MSEVLHPGVHDGPADLDVMAEACTHQLGEAAAIISGYVQELRRSGTSSPVALTAIDGAVERVRRVVEDLLDLTHLAGRHAGAEAFPLEEALVVALEQLDPFELRIEVQHVAMPIVVADRAQVVCAFRQLFRASAAARGPHQERVRISVLARSGPDRRVHVVVADDAPEQTGPLTGPGRGRGPLVGAGAMRMIVDRVAASHDCGPCRLSADGSRVAFELPGA